MTRTFLDGRVTLLTGDCRESIAGLPDASVDSVVTDPPYHLTNRTPDVKWCTVCNRVLGGNDGNPSVCPKCGGSLEYQRSQGGRGFMGKKWDGGDIAFQPETWAAILRVLKPGGHLVAFGGTRTYHRLACAIEDDGFEIRDAIMWHYGSGFPKSHDVSKGIDRAAGADRKVVGRTVYGDGHVQNSGESIGYGGSDPAADRRNLTAPATTEASLWQGWGTALKPATEIICLARKPLIGTVAENVLAHGTGAMNIDGCRIEAPGGVASGGSRTSSPLHMDREAGVNRVSLRAEGHVLGRWPANLIHDGSDEVLACFPETQSGSRVAGEYGLMGYHGADRKPMPGVIGDSGSASRFFYCAKADKDDRIGSRHPTVKPVDLMRWLCRLITPPGGTILDPFAGTGTTAEAAFYEGFNAILCELELEYIADIERRMRLVMAGPEERAREIIKAKMVDKPVDHGTLFAVDTAKEYTEALAACREKGIMDPWEANK